MDHAGSAVRMIASWEAPEGAGTSAVWSVLVEGIGPVTRVRRWLDADGLMWFQTSCGDPSVAALRSFVRASADPGLAALPRDQLPTPAPAALDSLLGAATSGATDLVSSASSWMEYGSSFVWGATSSASLPSAAAEEGTDGQLAASNVLGSSATSASSSFGLS